MSEVNKNKIEQAYKEWTNVKDILTEIYGFVYDVINDAGSIAELNNWYDKVKKIIDEHYVLEMFDDNIND